MNALSITSLAIHALSTLTSNANPSIITYPTFHSIGVTVTFEDNDDPSSSSKASVWYKDKESSDFIEGHECTFGYSTPTQLLFCNIMNVDSGLSYDIQVKFASGPFASTVLTAIATTRNENELEPSSALRNLYVSVDGNGDCSESDPCSLMNAISAASAGDHILLNDGVYYSGNHILPKGAIVQSLNDKDKVIFDGSMKEHKFEWIYEEENDYFYSDQIAISSNEEYISVIVNGQRLFPYQCLLSHECKLSLIDLGYANFSGVYYNTSQQRMYTKFGGFGEESIFDSNTDPNDLYFEVSEKNEAFRLLDGDNQIKGITFQNYGFGQYSKAIYVHGAPNVVISDNKFIHCTNSIGVKYESDNLVIQYNEFIDSKSHFLWESVKASRRLEGGGFVIYSSDRSAQGMVFRYNRFDNFFDCASVGSGKLPIPTSVFSHEIDVYDNAFYRCSDDAISVDGYCSNCRIWNNVISKSLVAVSLAPVYYGPIFVFRNVIYDLITAPGYSPYLQGYAFKTNSDYATSGTMYLYHNTIDNTFANGHMGMWTKSNGKWQLLVSRNNIYLGTDYAIILQNTHPSDFDYDCAYSVDRDPLYNFYWIDSWRSFDEFKSASGQETNGWFFRPSFQIAKQTNCYALDPVNDARLIDTAAIIPGINNVGFIGDGPDVGAIENGMYPVHALCSMLDFQTPVPTMASKKRKGSKSKRTKAPRPTKATKNRPSKGPKQGKGKKKSKRAGGPPAELFLKGEYAENEYANEYSLVHFVGSLCGIFLIALILCTRCYLNMQHAALKNIDLGSEAEPLLIA